MNTLQQHPAKVVKKETIWSVFFSPILSSERFSLPYGQLFQRCHVTLSAGNMWNQAALDGINLDCW